MRLHVILPWVKPAEVTLHRFAPARIPVALGLSIVNEVTKTVKDTVYEEAAAHRYKCLSSGRSFRVYPLMVTRT